MGITIKQGYPEKKIGEMEITDSGWFFNPNKDCKTIYEGTLRKMINIIERSSR